MRSKARAILSALLAALVLLSLGAAALWTRREAGEGPVQTAPAGAARAAARLPPGHEPAPAQMPATQAQAPPALAPAAERERPIEEQLAEAGEDPQAVKYVSRIRECLRGGNRAFAGELLRQMKERHAGSVLVEAAEDLWEREN